MITTERDVFLGAHVTTEVKEAIRTIARRQGISMSALVFNIIARSPEIKAILKIVPPPEATARTY